MVSLEGFSNVFWWDAPPISRIPKVDPEFPGANLPFKKLREIQAYIPSNAPETNFYIRFRVERKWTFGFVIK